jgi:hypothetical protein
MSLKLSEKYQQEFYDPKALPNEELPLQKQASDGPYRLNCKSEKMNT